MKAKNRVFFNVLFACISVAAILTLVATVMFSFKLHSVNTQLESVPYVPEQPPENSGFLFCFEEGMSEYIYLDFEQERISVIFLPHNAETNDVEEYGYTVFRTINADYAFLADFIDRFGGIELNIANETLRYTGVQVTELLSKSNERDLKKQIMSAVFKKISQNDFTRKDLVFIIENTQTDLSFPDGYSLTDYIGLLSENINYIN